MLRRTESNRLREPANRILDCARRLEHLIRGFNTFARDQKLNLTEIELPAFLQDIVEEWRPTTRRSRIQLGLDVAAAVRVRADEDQLRRVLDNLIKNAVEAIDHLREDGHPVLAYDSLAALPALETMASPTVLLTDYQMRGEDGLSLARRFHAVHPRVQVVLATAYWTAHLEFESAGLDFVHLLRKPLEYEALHKALHRLGAKSAGP